MRPPRRRVLAVDAGARWLKLLLAESEFGQPRIVQHQKIDLQQEGLVSPEEISSHLQATLREWGTVPQAAVLPQHLSISQVIDLPLGPESEVEKLIQDETIKLSGVSESKIVYDFVPLEAASGNRRQFWVTLSRESDIRERIAEFGIAPGDLCDVTTTANALIAAYRATSVPASRAILLHIGEQSTVLIVVLAGRGAFATTFQMGADFFARALARGANEKGPAGRAEPESAERSTAGEFNPQLIAAVNGWAAELKRQLQEWFEHHRELGDWSSFDFIASGEALEMPGLLACIRSQAGLILTPWSNDTQPDVPSCPNGFEVVLGAAVQALGFSPQPVSLVPSDYRAAWEKRIRRDRIETISVVLLVLCALFFGLATWQKVSLLNRKATLLAKVKEGIDSVQANQQLTGELVSEYETLRPVFAQQQNTLDTLKALSLLQQARSNRDFWFVFVADQQSYFHAPTGLGQTNQAATNAPSWAQSNLFELIFLTVSNSSAAKPGLIAEVCVPGESDSARRTLSQLVNDLNQQRLFSKVDLLSDDLRRNLADPKLTIPERHFVLALDFAETHFRQSLRPAARLPHKRPSRPGVAAAEPQPSDRWP